MAAIELRKKVIGMVEVEQVVKPALRALKCDSCGKIFQMRGPAAALLQGIFNRTVHTPQGYTCGNTFRTVVCSFHCAGEIFSGGWRKLSFYKRFAEQGAELEQVALTITTHVKYEKELLREWEAGEEK